MNRDWSFGIELKGWVKPGLFCMNWKFSGKVWRMGCWDFKATVVLGISHVFAEKLGGEDPILSS